MDGRRTHGKMLLSHTLTMRGSDAASLVDSAQWFRREVSVTDRWTDDGGTGKKMLLSHTLTMRESNVASLVDFRSVV